MAEASRFGRIRLVLDIAATHLSSRVRQTIVGGLGVAMGVGFSIMMAALMVGSQRDFVEQLVDALPHVTMRDERRDPPRQPAEDHYETVDYSGLRTPETRPGLKNPLALLAMLEGWMPGAAAPSVETRAVIRYAGRDMAASVTGVAPKRERLVSKLPEQIRQGVLDDLYTSSNAVILGDRLAEKIGVRVGAAITLVGGRGRPITCTVVGFYHSGIAAADESQAFVLMKTAQILAGRSGLVNAIRIRVDDVISARAIAARVEAQTGYKSVSWQEANEDLLSAFEIRNFIMYTVVGAILLVASFGTYNIVSTITHEKTRDIAILKSIGFTQQTVQSIFLLEALFIGLAGSVLGWIVGYCLCLALGTIEFKSPFADTSRLPIAYDAAHYVIATTVAMAASGVAGYLPARKAAQRHPVDIIRGAS